MDKHPVNENIVRAFQPGVQSRDADDGKPPTLFGHFARFNAWNEIDSAFEGHFMERLLPGAFTKSFQEQRDNIKALYDHGHDPTVGNKPLGAIAELREDDIGPYYEVPLIDTSYNRDLIPALDAGLLGASYRFSVPAGKQDWDEEPGGSEFNPLGLPERTIREVNVYELSAVTFPADQGATAGIRSLTDRYLTTDAISVPSMSFTPEPPDGTPEEPDESAPGEPQTHSQGSSPARRKALIRAFHL